MSRLEELINEYCPDGVEYRCLKDISTKIVDGMHNLPKGLSSEGDFPVISAQNIDNNVINLTTKKYADKIVFDKENKRTNIQPEDVLLTIVGAIGRSAVVKDEKMLFQRSVCIITPDSNQVLSWFLKYVFDSSFLQNWMMKNAHGAAQKGLYIKQVERIRIPVPPLEVQREIVRILDNFTEFTAELTAELTARKKQYEYYMNEVLNYAEYEEKRLCEVAEVVDSLHSTPNYSDNGFSMVRVTDVTGGQIDLIKTKKVDKETYDIFTKKMKPQKDDIIVSRVGSFGKFSIVPKDNCCCLGQNTALIHPLINSRFLYYYLSSDRVIAHINSKVNGGSQKTLSLAEIKRLPVRIPSKAQQQRIVKQLNSLESICFDLTSGLPAEIEARQKQYEYYRDKLLTFKEKTA